MNPLFAFPIGLISVLALGAPVIAWLKSKKSVQPISPDAPEKHRLKHGTPTMGGLLLLVGTAAGTLASVTASPPAAFSSLLAVLAVFLAGGVIGFLDDLGKARKKENKAGLSERAKLGLQLLVAILFTAWLYLRPDAESHLILRVDLGVWYSLFAVLLICGMGNAANFTDGLDGLATGITFTAALVLGQVAREFGRAEQGFYLALAGSCVGFLWFNRYPARVFMGDTGSLALGMGLAAAALAAKQELLLLVVGAVYLAEIASMMLQRYVFKYRRLRYGLEYAQSHRVFRRAPLHHHFEELGWPERRVVACFWSAGIVAAVIGWLLRDALAVPMAVGMGTP